MIAIQPRLHFTQPFVVRTVVCEMVGVALYVQTGAAKDGWELMAEVAIAKEDDTQATCSYTTASLISPTVRS